MKTAVVSNALDLWEAWIDLSSDTYVLYVIGDICTGCSKMTPMLVKKRVQGAPASHLILELLSFGNPELGRLTEVGYAEPVDSLHQYQHISICAGEEVIAQIPEIEVVY